MRTIKILVLLLTMFNNPAQSQNNKHSSDQENTIDISNSNGALSISFKDGAVSSFVINDVPVSKENYDNYQEIIDTFCQENTKEKEEAPEKEEESKGDQLKKLMMDYLMGKGYINSFKKYKVEMKKKYLKINGKKMPIDIHIICLDFFKQVYKEDLNEESNVYFKKSRNKSTSSISISN